MVGYGEPWLTILFYHSQPWLNNTQKHGLTMVLFGRVGHVCLRSALKDVELFDFLSLKKIFVQLFAAGCTVFILQVGYKPRRRYPTKKYHGSAMVFKVWFNHYG